MFSNTTTVIMMILFGVSILLTTIIIPDASSFRGGVFVGATGAEKTSRAPTVISGENVYVAWWSNKTGNDEVLFRASNDAGLTFGDKINLSNTTTSESVDAEIAAEGENVYVTWWERNQTANEPVLRISTDTGATFGPLLQLSHNGTLGNTDDSE